MKVTILCLVLLVTLNCPRAEAAKDQADEVAAAASAYQSGLNLRDALKLDEALAKFDEGLRHQPDSAEILFARGVTWQWKGDLDKAQADIERAIALNPSKHIYEYQIANVKAAKASILMDEAFKQRQRYGIQGPAYQAALDMAGSDAERDDLREHYDSLCAAQAAKKDARTSHDALTFNDEGVCALERTQYETPHRRHFADGVIANHKLDIALAEFSYIAAFRRNPRDRDWQVVFDKFYEALKIDPQSPLVRENLAITHNNFGLELYSKLRIKQALIQLHQACYIQPENLTTAGNLNGVIEMTRKCPESFNDRLALAEQASADNDLVGALVEYRSALKLMNDEQVRKHVDELCRLIPPTTESSFSIFLLPSLKLFPESPHLWNHVLFLSFTHPFTFSKR